MAFNLEVHDINKDGKQDIIVGNWNDTYVFFGGKGVLDSTVDVVYRGRMLTVCDYNGDGLKDLIAMHFTRFDSSRLDYSGEILFYYGSDTSKLAIDTIPDYSIPLPTKYPTRDRFALGYGRAGVEYGDFNKDGKMDIVINSIRSLSMPADTNAHQLDDYGGTIYIYMGSTAPSDTATFIAHGGKSFVPGKPPFDMYGNIFHIGDINGDGYSDLVFSAKAQTVPPNSKDSIDLLYIYLGNKTFSFAKDGETIKYESRLMDYYPYSYGWFNKYFSLADINGDGYSDLIISEYDKDSTNHVHFGSPGGFDTIPSFYITNPDPKSLVVGGVVNSIGDFNNDGYGDFLLSHSAYKSFTLHLGGPRLSNSNPYGLRGLLEAPNEFPTQAINCGDQNGDGVKDFVVSANPYVQNEYGYILIFLGDPKIVAGVDEQEVPTPETFELLQNYPNPFNPSTVISFRVSVKSFVTLKVYDILGREVTTLVNDTRDGGFYTVTLDGTKFASSMYFYRMIAGNYIATKKMILQK